MRNLIKKILKEEVHNDYDMVRKGIDILISLLTKNYPFIVGWRPSDEDIDGSTWYINIDLVISASKAKEYYNMDYKRYYYDYPEVLEQEIFNSNNDYAYPVSLFDYESHDFKPYEQNGEIKEFAEQMYELIPEEYKLKEERISSFSNTEYINIKEVKLNAYFFVK
jgi:hypothetical protein